MVLVKSGQETAPVLDHAQVLVQFLPGPEVRNINEDRAVEVTGPDIHKLMFNL